MGTQTPQVDTENIVKVLYNDVDFNLDLTSESILFWETQGFRTRVSTSFVTSQFLPDYTVYLNNQTTVRNHNTQLTAIMVLV